MFLAYKVILMGHWNLFTDKNIHDAEICGWRLETGRKKAWSWNCCCATVNIFILAATCPAFCLLYESNIVRLCHWIPVIGWARSESVIYWETKLWNHTVPSYICWISKQQDKQILVKTKKYNYVNIFPLCRKVCNNWTISCTVHVLLLI